MQNKLHYATHGRTAAELIVERADHYQEHMGLTTWADVPDGKIKKSDVTIAKNYLSEFEIGQLDRMVSAYLDFAESMTLRHIPLTMQDWETRLNGFIEMFEYGLQKMQEKYLRSLQNYTQKLNLRNIASFKMNYFCLISINTC